MFPDLRFAGFDPEDVTIRDLLVHTSGIDNPALVWATAFSGVHDAQSRRRLVAASRPHEEAARGAFEYTNVGYNILSVWLDERFGMSWQDQLDNTLFEPLGMQRTSARMSEASMKGWPLAEPYSFASAEPDEPLYLVKTDNTMHAAGGMVSTAPDLAKFLVAQLSSGVPGDHPVLPAALIDRSHVPQVTLESSYL
ncbi:serine hydrolase domain-containing protein, partial [Novilysobacter viscosus]